MNRSERRRRSAIDRKTKAPKGFRPVVDVRRERSMVHMVCPGCGETIGSVADIGQDDDAVRHDATLGEAFREHHLKHEYKCYEKMGAVRAPAMDRKRRLSS